MSLGNSSVHQEGEIPEITKLPNGRIRVVRRFIKFTREDVDNVQLGTLLGDFGDLDTTDEQIPNQGYTNCRLIGVEVEKSTTRSSGTDSSSFVLVQTYETLTDVFVETTDPTISYSENGLKKVTRVFRAVSGTTSSNVVGSSTFVSGATTTYLASSLIDDNTAFAELTEVYLEAGTLSETLDNVGSQKAKVIETIGTDPATPDGYSLASKQESDFEGFQTNRFTFLKNNVVLSESEDKVGSQLAITQEVFNGTPTTPAGYLLANTQKSDVGGIPTSRYTFLKPSVLSKSTDNVGSQKAKVIETFSDTPVTPTGYSLASNQESDFEGIKTNRYTFLKNNAVLSRSIQTKNNGKLTLEVVEVFNGTPAAETAGAVKIGDEVSDVDGIPTRRFTFAKGDGQISVDSRPAPAQLAGCTYVTVRSLGTPVTPTGVLVAESETESDGYITYEKTAIQGAIVGTKQTYKDVVDVTVAGVVDCTEVSKTSGGISGTIAVAKVTPPRTKTLAATVTVEVTTSPPDTASLAYDLGDISCSVTSISMSEDFRGTDVFTTQSGRLRFSGQRKSSNMSARVSTYPNCYLSSSTGTGVFSYTSSYENNSTSPNKIIPVAQDSTTRTFTDGTGSRSASYSTTGVVERSSRPILTALDGTIYFEVVTWSV